MFNAETHIANIETPVNDGIGSIADKHNILWQFTRMSRNFVALLSRSTFAIPNGVVVT